MSSDLTAEGGHGAVPTGPEVPVAPKPAASRRDWPLYEVFVRGKRGLNHVHVGSLHAPDDDMALRNARDLYTRRNEGVSVWVARSTAITTSDPDQKGAFFESPAGKNYRHAKYYEKSAEVPHL